MREVDYAPQNRAAEGKRHAAVEKNGVGLRQPAQQLASAKARRAQALLIRDAAMASLPAVRASDDGQKNDEATATNILLAIYEDDLSEPPHKGDGTAGDRTTTSLAGEVPAAAPIIRGLQVLGRQLLLKREENEFLLRQKEMELEHRRLDLEERRTTLAQRKLTLEEERLKMEAQRQNSTQILQEMSNKLDQLEKKLLAYTKKETVSKESAQFFGLKYSSS
ncbi:hypothetical protein MRX96_037934 [Rhipicephalus microplus]